MPSVPKNLRRLAWPLAAGLLSFPITASETPQIDAYGRVVLDEDGRRHNYTWAETEGLTRRAETPDLHDEGARNASRLPSDSSKARKSAGPLDPANPLDIQVEWYRTVFGRHIGEAGLLMVDLGGSASPEVIAATRGGDAPRPDHWFTLAADGSGFSKTWTSHVQPTIQRLAAGDLDGDGDHEIVIASASELEVRDGSPPSPLYTIQLPGGSPVGGLHIHDVDLDGEAEIVLCDDGTQLHVLDGATGAVEWQVPLPAGCQDLAIGQVDDDPAPEIVVAGDGAWFEEKPALVVDGLSRATESLVGLDFGSRVELGDLDGDGRDEIVSAERWYHVEVVDWSPQDGFTLAYDLRTDRNIDALHLADWDTDGDLEILWADGQWGSIHFLDGASGALEHEVPNPNHGVTELLVADVLGDGTPHLVWGAGWSASADEHLFIVDLTRPDPPWQSLDVRGPFLAMASADLDLDGEPELLSGSFESEKGTGDGLWFVHDGATKALEFASPEPTGNNWMGLTRLRTAQVDGDPQPEIFLTTSAGYTPQIIAYDGLTKTQDLVISGENGLRFLGLELVDVDLDGDTEAVVTTGREHSGPAAVVAEVYDAATGVLEWRSPPLTTLFADFESLRVAEVDGDGRPEILVGFAPLLWAFDGVTGSTEWTADLDASCLDTADTDGDGVAEIFVGTEDGEILRVDGATGQAETVLTVGPGAINALQVEDLDADGLEDFTFVHQSRLRILSAAGDALFFGELLGPNAGAADSLSLGDVDGDGQREIWVNMGRSGFVMYQIGFEETDLPPQFSITTPTPGSVATAGASIRLEATALDPEDGDLSAFVQWSSDLVGEVGTGASLEVFLPLGLHTLTAEAVDSAGNVASSTVAFEVQAPPASVADVLARWRFDEGGGPLAFDVSGNGHHAALSGGAGFTPGVEGLSLALDGVGAHAAVPAAPALDALTALTATAWVRHDRVSAWRSVIDKRDAGSDGFDLYLERTGRGFVRINATTLTGATLLDDGAWHHLAAVYDGATVTLYVDGVVDASAPAAAGDVLTSGPLLLGRNFDSGFFFGGDLDDVRLYGRALDAAEIATVLDEVPPRRFGGSPSGILPSGSASAELSLDTDEAAECRYATAAETPFDTMTSQLTTTGGTSHGVTVAPLADGVTYAYYVRCRDAAGHVNGDDYVVTFQVAGPGDVDLGLAGHWPFDEGTGHLALDASGGGHDGSIVGAQWTPGRFGSGLDFAGSGDAVAVAASPAFGAPQTVTMAAWVRLGAGSTGFRAIVDVRDGNTDGYDLFVDDQSRLFIRVNTHKLAGATALDDGAWHHVVGVYDGDRLLLYVDGALDAELSVGPSPISTTGALRLGDHFSASGTYSFSGALDEVRLYDRVLGPAEIAVLASP